ncbi:MAG: rhodanese-like domain-containing protein [Betaproteobacteria bacterium]|nr:rhodanese-like domain-containing protein [Betaproteobacteria bacterium]
MDNTKATLLINREDALVLDVRGPPSLPTATSPRADNIPLAQLEVAPRQAARQVKPVIVVCNSGQNLAPKAGALLRAQGFANVHTLAGGYQAWLSGGMPVEKK